MKLIMSALGICVFFVPIVLLWLLYYGIVKVLEELRMRRRRMSSMSFNAFTPESPELMMRSPFPIGYREDRTTKLVMSILLFYLIAIIPYGFHCLFFSSLGDDYYTYVHLPLHDVWSTMNLVYCQANFLFLILMSSSYRKTLRGMFGATKIQDPGSSVCT
jgi:hypothetical protein